MISIEKNIAIRNKVRTDLNTRSPVGPVRYFYRRGAWRPMKIAGGQYVDVPEGHEVEFEEWEFQSDKSTFYVPISLSTSGYHVIIPSAFGRRIKIHFLTFTVTSEVYITLFDGSKAMSGAMSFGAVGAPKGIVLPPDGISFELDRNNAFIIYLNANVSVAGMCIYSYVI